MRKFIVYQKLRGGFCGFSFHKHSPSHFAVGRFLFSTNIYIFIIIFLWVKKKTFQLDNSGLGFLFSSREKQEGGRLASHYRHKCGK